MNKQEFRQAIQSRFPKLKWDFTHVDSNRAHMAKTSMSLFLIDIECIGNLAKAYLIYGLIQKTTSESGEELDKCLNKLQTMLYEIRDTIQQSLLPAPFSTIDGESWEIGDYKASLVVDSCTSLSFYYQGTRVFSTSSPSEINYICGELDDKPVETLVYFVNKGRN